MLSTAVGLTRTWSTAFNLVNSWRRCVSSGPRQTAIVLLSGGLDSATVLAIAGERFRCIALSFDYGQRHKHELLAAKELATYMKASKHVVVKLDLRVIGGSALTTDDIEVPKGRKNDEMSKSIPVTYVPARNTIFLSYAMALAETHASDHIFIGANAVDYSGYPDCRPEYFEAFQNMAKLESTTSKAVLERHRTSALTYQHPLSVPVVMLSTAFPSHRAINAQISNQAVG
uniref:7-cyano-7-deazaguanine synthase n=1 Tax=Rhodosorus marinus TaxID=101924 RepID=A0A7S2ZPZ1_9RHOD|mmetsp:Transcript_27831/g.109131  ORF Transcript_27831/g.109131 Transcript_27831/m.109131 type:complete len:230 (+) Transcript_27831:147-836(+)